MARASSGKINAHGNTANPADSRENFLADQCRANAALLLENQALIETHSATELSTFARVSKATTARFFRNLGHNDFDEARSQAREERNRTQPYAYSRALAGNRGSGPVDRRSSGAGTIEPYRTNEEMRPDLLTEAARLIQRHNGFHGW